MNMTSFKILGVIVTGTVNASTLGLSAYLMSQHFVWHQFGSFLLSQHC
jgi:hypothetical protein